MFVANSDPGRGRAVLHHAGEELWLDSRGALYWPAQDAVMVADLHLEKGSSFARFGSFLPPYDTRQTLNCLAQVLDTYRPRQLFILGDSFHDPGALARMAPSDQAALDHIRQRLEHVAWIAGNHDDALLRTAGWRASDSICLPPFLLEHARSPGTHGPVIFGHFHPSLSVKAGGVRVRGRCFAVAGDAIVLPAFGAYAGGLDIRSDDFLRAVGPVQRAYLCYRDSIIEIRV